MVTAGIVLKLALEAEFHRTRFPADSFMTMRRTFYFMSLEERRQYRREAAEYLRRSGYLTYNRLLTVMIVLGALGFVAFGYFADPRFPKNKRKATQSGSIHMSLT